MFLCGQTKSNHTTKQHANKQTWRAVRVIPNEPKTCHHVGTFSRIVIFVRNRDTEKSGKTKNGVTIRDQKHVVLIFNRDMTQNYGATYRLVQIERQKLCPREFLTPFFRVRPRNFAHIFWKAVSKTRRGVFFNLGFRCRDIRVLTPPRVKYSSRDPE